MSLLVEQAEWVVAEPREPRRWPIKEWSIGIFTCLQRFVVGVLLCFNPLLAVLVVGWTFRAMRRSILRGWWSRSPIKDEVDFEAFAASQGGEVPASPLPRWFLAERASERLNRAGQDGEPPSRLHRALRMPVAAVEGLGCNAKVGLRALLCTYVLTLPGCFLWLGSWYAGWNTSFNKGYEQAFVGVQTGFLGHVLFIAAMLYVPMAWAHLAATGDARAFFQFGLVARLIRHRIGILALFAAVVSLATLPASILRIAPSLFTHIDPTLENASPEQVAQIVAGYTLASGLYLFPAFVGVHLLAAGLYRSALPRVLRRQPELVDRLPDSLRESLRTLRMLPDGPESRRHPLVAVVLGTSRKSVHIAAWVAAAVLWFTLIAQLYIQQFFNYLPAAWLIQPLIHLPVLQLAPAGGS